MQSTKNFTYKRIINNKKITLKFKADSFCNNIIIFNIFRKRLFTKMKINIDKVFVKIPKLLSKIEKNKIEKNPNIILKYMNNIFDNYENQDKNIQINKLYELLEYITINKQYFKESYYVMQVLSKKLIKLYFSNNDLKKIKYYYFLIFNLENLNIESLDITNDNNLEDDDIDFYLDNIQENLNFTYIEHDLNFYL